jgi:uncharacterized protein involved in exopolysaccharide biosynthesis
MFTFDTTTAGPPAAPVAPGLRRALDVNLAIGVARRHVRMIVAGGLLGAFVAYYASGLLTPKYVATAEIYVDPGPAQGSTSDPITPGQDSNGFVNYVETQKLIVTSRSVLERAARAEGLDRDPDFVGSAVSSLWGRLFHPAAPAGDQVSVAARALAPHVFVARPERTFVLDISVTDRDPDRAAELANAMAKAYIEEVSKLRADAARQTSAAIDERLENLRLDVIKAEQAIEAYRTAHDLAGARDGSTIEVQLKALQDQMAAQRARESESRARADGAEAARKNGGADLPAFASQFGLMTLTQLRGQQAEARQKLADVRTNLGPRHPQAIEAEARLKSANDAIDSELERFARSQRLEYQRAKAAQVDLQRQIDLVMTQTNTDNEALVGLRDLERKAQAARDVYALFVQRSRDAGIIQEIAPTRTKIISAAAPPRGRTFPPSGATLAGLGFVAGLGVGFLAALLRDGVFGRLTQPAAPEPDPQPDPEPDPAPIEDETAAAPRPRRPLAPLPRPVVATAVSRRHLVGLRARLVARPRELALDALELAALGFPAPSEGADLSEFVELLEALPADPDGRRAVAVVGSNDASERTTLAVVLAIAAARAGRSVALLDAAGRNARLTRAVRLATHRTLLEGGPGYDTAEGVRLVLPKAGDGEGGRLTALEALDDLIEAEAYDLILLDGPAPQEAEADVLFDSCDAIVGLDDGVTEARLDELGFASDALAVFAAPAATERKRA